MRILVLKGLRKESPCVFSKFNPLNMDTRLILTLSMPLSVSVLTGSVCMKFTSERRGVVPLDHP